ncbi:MAG TPA: hypothetical protein VGG64_28725 [Pirellulales bacterium]|jgi:hypothetical protein
MKIECISNCASGLPDELIRPELGLRRDRMFSLGVGTQYVVYGFTYYLGHIWYYICDGDYTYYPVWNPSPLFRIVDNRLSSFWRVGIYAVGSAGLPMPIVAFDEWVGDPLFYDKLTDGEGAAVALFKGYKRLIDEEFAA